MVGFHVVICLGAASQIYHKNILIVGLNKSYSFQGHKRAFFCVSLLKKDATTTAAIEYTRPIGHHGPFFRVSSARPTKQTVSLERRISCRLQCVLPCSHCIPWGHCIQSTLASTLVNKSVAGCSFLVQ